MFDKKQQQLIGSAVEKILLDLNHPGIPKKNVNFSLRVYGKIAGSWAHITPSWRSGDKITGRGSCLNLVDKD